MSGWALDIGLWPKDAFWGYNLSCIDVELDVKNPSTSSVIHRYGKVAQESILGQRLLITIPLAFLIFAICKGQSLLNAALPPHRSTSSLCINNNRHCKYIVWLQSKWLCSGGGSSIHSFIDSLLLSVVSCSINSAVKERVSNKGGRRRRDSGVEERGTCSCHKFLMRPIKSYNAIENTCVLFHFSPLIIHSSGGGGSLVCVCVCVLVEMGRKVKWKDHPLLFACTHF